MRFHHDPSGNQFAFTAGVGGDNERVNVFSCHKSGHGFVLLCGLFNDHKLHLFGQHRKILKPPRFIFVVVKIGVGEGDKMTERPCDNVSVAFYIAVSFAVCADHSCNITGNRRFFGKYKLFSHNLSILFI